MPTDRDRARAREWGKSRYPENMMISGWWKGDTESLARLLAEVRAEVRAEERDACIQGARDWARRQMQIAKEKGSDAPAAAWEHANEGWIFARIAHAMKIRAASAADEED